MIKLLVVADDFTGALDTGVQFSKSGIGTLVSIDREKGLPLISGAAEVLVVDTGSRHVSGGEAYTRVKAAALQARRAGIAHIYKKTDSTLRGNVGSELAAAMDAWESPAVMFVPAYPKTGRTTVGGKQFVNGVPLHETGFARDPLNPITTSFIPDILKHMEARVIGRDEISGFNAERGQGRRVYIFDGETDEDLHNIGSVLKRRKLLSVTAGCAGFAAHLPGLLGLEGGKSIERAEGTGLLAVCGSVNEASFRQIRRAEENGFTSFTLPPEAKLSADYTDSQAGIELLGRIAGSIKEGKDVLVKTADSRQQADSLAELAGSFGMAGDELPLAVAKNTGNFIKKLLDLIKAPNIAVFGGDTAVEIIKAAGCGGIMPVDELEPGVALSRASRASGDFNLISKAGGFGSDEVLLKIKEYLKGGK